MTTIFHSFLKKNYISRFDPVYVEDCNFVLNEAVMSTINYENTQESEEGRNQHYLKHFVR